MLFEFKIYDKEMIRINKGYVINIDNYHKCKFYFDKETWQDKELFVTFINKDGYYQTVILGKWAETLSCSVPAHMLDFDYYKIFCYSKDMYKTNTLKVYSNKKNSQCNVRTNKRTDVIKHLANTLKTKIDNIVFEDNQLKCYSENNLVDTVYIDNVDEVLVKNIIDTYLIDFENKMTNQLEQELAEQLDDYLNNDDLDYLIISL